MRGHQYQQLKMDRAIERTTAISSTSSAEVRSSNSNRTFCINCISHTFVHLAYLLIIMTGEMITLYVHKRVSVYIQYIYISIQAFYSASVRTHLSTFVWSYKRRITDTKYLNLMLNKIVYRHQRGIQVIDN